MALPGKNLTVITNQRDPSELDKSIKNEGSLPQAVAMSKPHQGPAAYQEIAGNPRGSAGWKVGDYIDSDDAEKLSPGDRPLSRRAFRGMLFHVLTRFS